MKRRRPVVLPPRPPVSARAPDEPARPWFRIDRPQNQADGAVASLYIYDEISWWGITADELVKELNALDARRIDLHINSPGGEAWDGVAIYNALLSHPAYVDVIVDGLAASAASLIAQAGDNIRMATGTSMMIHDAIGFCVGPAEDMRKTGEMLDSLSDSIAGIYAERTDTQIAQWRSLMLDETWFSPQEAVAAGLADEVVSLRKSEPTDGFDLSHFRYSGRDHAPQPRIGQPPRDTASPVHHTGTDKESSWSKSDNEGRLPSPMPLATAKRFYAAYDADRVEDGQIVKDACHLPHHNVSQSGSVGAANIAGVNNALARLNQTQTEDKEGAQRHLKAHQTDAGVGGDDDDADDGADDLFDLDVTALAELRQGLHDATADDFEREYDPDVLRAAIRNRADNAPATPAGATIGGEVESPISMEAAKAVGDALWEALQ